MRTIRVIIGAERSDVEMDSQTAAVPFDEAMETWSDATLARVRLAGYRGGAAQRAVVELLGRESCCLTAQEIFDRLRGGRRRVSLASVYRTLDRLSELGLVQRVEVGQGSARFERAAAENHHHHLVCNDCGRVEAFSDEPLERAIHGVASKVGYDVEAHDVVLHGACADCAA
jgi:Fur family transcriptional regulator, ferric uptake regulator